MMALISLYWLAILAGIMAAANLAFIGAHLAARDKAMQTLCLGQGATLGVLLGLGLIPIVTSSDAVLHFGPFVSAILFSLIAYQVTEAIAHGKMASRNTYYTTVFGVLLALGYLVSSLFPSLENHLAQVFFGDLATLTNGDATFVLILSTIVLIFLSRQWKTISNDSFETALFPQRIRTKAPSRALFEILAVASLCFSVQFLGLLFTLTSLFLPTVLLHSQSRPSLRRHLLLCPIVAAAGTLLGFFTSLSISILPTVPTIVIAVLGVGLFISIVTRATR